MGCERCWSPGLQTFMGDPQWWVYFMETPKITWMMIWGDTPFQDTSICIYIQTYTLYMLCRYVCIVAPSSKRLSLPSVNGFPFPSTKSLGGPIAYLPLKPVSFKNHLDSQGPVQRHTTPGFPRPIRRQEMHCQLDEPIERRNHGIFEVPLFQAWKQRHYYGFCKLKLRLERVWP